MDRILVFVKYFGLKGLSALPCNKFYVVKHLLFCNPLANQNQISYVAFLQRKNGYMNDPGNMTKMAIRAKII